jgi:SAM-dependent methyltransferase
MSASAIEAYARLAERFDAIEAENRILRFMRVHSLEAVLAEMPEGGRLLELGSGTGTEAVAVARAKGSKVVAVEPTTELATIVKSKASAAHLQVEVHELGAFAALQALAGRGEMFDGAWSSFALAYEVPLEQLRAPLAAVLNPAAPFVCSLRNPWCLCEPWSIPSRRAGRYRHKVGEARVPLRHYSVRQAVGALLPEFRLESYTGLAVLVPPPRYGVAWNRLGALASAIERLDARVAGRFPTMGLGDHTLFRFRRM